MTRLEHGPDVDDLDRLVGAFLATPDPTTYGALRAAVLTMGAFVADVAPDELAQVLRTQEPEAAVQTLEALLPGALLSPSVHGALALALHRCGRGSDAARQRALHENSLAAILATGSGTREQPWQVLRVSDEHDVLHHLRRRPRGQQLVRDGAADLDRLECAGGDVWFEVVAARPAGAA
jgi:hypothetical protein